MFGKKSKKSPKPPQKTIHLGIPINIAAGPLGFRTELDTDPAGDQNCSYHDPEPDQFDSTVALDKNKPGSSRVVFHDEKREDQKVHTPETSTAGGVTDRSSEHRNDPTSQYSLSLLSRPMFIHFTVFLYLRRERR
jgi:hypothetical protein